MKNPYRTQKIAIFFLLFFFIKAKCWQILNSVGVAEQIPKYQKKRKRERKEEKEEGEGKRKEKGISETIFLLISTRFCK